MKKLYIILFALLSIPMVIGCNSNKDKEFEVENGLYFSVRRGTDADTTRWAHFPDTPVSFLTENDNEIVRYIKVQLTGELKNYDRPFVCNINSDSTTAIEGVNYELMEKNLMIKAGEYQAYIPIKIFRTDDILEHEKVIGLMLAPNEHFRAVMPVWYPIPSLYDKEKFNAQYHTVIISNFVTIPPFWEGRVENGKEISTWGEFSVDKYNLMCQLCNLTYDDFTAANMPAARKNMVKETMARHLQKLYNGYPETQPVKEKDGRLMWVTGCTWSSFIGEPWVPENK